MVTVYGIPECDAVKKARRFLDASEFDHEFFDLTERRLPIARVGTWAVNLTTKALKNTSSLAYRALPSEKSQWKEHQWVAAFVRDPLLLRRPIIEVDGVPVLVGFPRDEAAVRFALGLPAKRLAV